MLVVNDAVRRSGRALAFSDVRGEVVGVVVEGSFPGEAGPYINEKVELWQAFYTA